MTFQKRFLITSSTIISCIFTACTQPSNGPSLGNRAQAIKQIGGGQYVTIGAGSLKKTGYAQEAFHKKAQQNQKSGSYKYRCQIRKNAHARTSNGGAIPYGAGPVAGGAMLIGNVIAMQHERASTYSASGNTTPQNPLSISKNSAVAIRVVTSPEAVETIAPNHKKTIKSNLATATKSLGFKTKASAPLTLTGSVLRASDTSKWITVELTLKERRSGKTVKGFLMTQKKSSSGTYSIHEQVMETLKEMTRIR